MTAPSAPREPKIHSRRGLMSAGFWAMMILCLLCVAGGAALVFLGPTLWRATPADGRRAARPAGALAAPTGAPAAVDPSAERDIVGRLRSLERQQAVAVNAA